MTSQSSSSMFCNTVFYFFFRCGDVKKIGNIAIYIGSWEDFNKLLLAKKNFFIAQELKGGRNCRVKVNNLNVT